jgi:hypothetical protein
VIRTGLVRKLSACEYLYYSAKQRNHHLEPTYSSSSALKAF